MKNTFYFFVGSNPKISKKELEFLYQTKFNFLNKEVLFAELDKIPQQEVLGGVIKIAQKKAVILKSEILSFIKEDLKNSQKKLNLSINYYGKEKFDCLKFLKVLKKELKISLRYVQSKNENVSPIVSLKQVLRKKGKEYNLFLDNDNLIITETISVQDPDFYALRDYHKKWRDMKVGMMSPKLSQILINLAGSPQKFWDPFCGTGTIVVEGFIQGKEIFATDNNEQMLKAINTNLDFWLKKHPDFVYPQIDFYDVNQENFKNNNFKTVITEGYLGEEKQSFPSKKEALKTDNELYLMYKNFIQHNPQIKKIVCCLPVYNLNFQEVLMEKTNNLFQDLGFKNALSKDMIYRRKKQWVYRQILLLER
jgi:tRNA G10  N-methylase Trm11